ncbi:DUF2520 domain-containing protein [Oscillospiraceae bacterium CM]|nr:DUF2520 domain-containing protein [Oscillospiraceae bacterium CM]
MKIGFFGAGKAGTALGLYFRRHGIALSGYASRRRASSQAAGAITCSDMFKNLTELAEASDVIFLTVPDDALCAIDASVAASIERGEIGREKIWLHTSGAHASSCLKNIVSSGGAVGSVHPLLSFGDPETSAARLDGTVFSVEGSELAVAVATKILEKTGAQFQRIAPEKKPLYHAAACVVSNHLVTLIDSGTRLFEAAGMDREAICQALFPLVDATLDNVRKKGPANALTGPVARGDVTTIRAHLSAIESTLPQEAAFYKAAALKTARMAAARLTPKQAAALQFILEE